MAAAIKKYAPRVAALRDRVAARPRIKAYLASDRRQSFNEDGIFRHYPELDGYQRRVHLGVGLAYEM